MNNPEPYYPTIKENILNQLRDDLISGELSPEQELNINELCQKYKVSRTPIREAIAYLESMGLVEIINYRGIKVAKYLSDEIHEIYYMRGAISGLAAKLSARNMAIEQKQKLLDNVSASRIAVHNKDIDAFLVFNKEFHGELEKQIKTRLIKSLSEQFFIITKRYRMLGIEVRNEEQLIQEHELIAKAVFEGDEEKAEYYGRLHYTNTMDFLEKESASAKTHV